MQIDLQQTSELAYLAEKAVQGEVVMLEKAGQPYAQITSAMKRQSGKLRQRVPNLTLDANAYLAGDEAVAQLFGG